MISTLRMAMSSILVKIEGHVYFRRYMNPQNLLLGAI